VFFQVYYKSRIPKTQSSSMPQPAQSPFSPLCPHGNIDYPIADFPEVSWFSDDSSDSDDESDDGTWFSDSDFSTLGPQTPYSISPRLSASHLATDGLVNNLWKPVYRKPLPKLPYSQCPAQLSPPVSPRTIPAPYFAPEKIEIRPSVTEPEIQGLKTENWIMVRRIQRLEQENAELLLNQTRSSPPATTRTSTQSISRNVINRRTSSF